MMRSTVCMIALCVLALLSLTQAQMVKSAVNDTDSDPRSAASVQAAVLDCLQANDEAFCIALLHIKENNETESGVKVTAEGGCEKNATDMTCQEHIHLTYLNETTPADKPDVTIKQSSSQVDDAGIESHETHEFAEVHDLAAPVQRRRSPVTRVSTAAHFD